MKLLQINDSQYVNPDMIAFISDNNIDGDSCWIILSGTKDSIFCDRYSAQQLMSIICEEVYYENDGIRKDD